MEISKEQWQAAINQWVIVTIWTPKGKQKIPTIKAAGDYPTYAKARAAKKRMEKSTGYPYADERRTIYVARKFDVTKLNLFDTYIISDEKAD